MAAGYRAMGPRNATLPQATESVIAFMHDPARAAWQQYIQLVPLQDVSEGLYRYPTIHPDDTGLRLVNYAQFAWGWDDKRPSGEDLQPRVIWTAGETTRWAFGYTLGERTNKAWSRNTKINPQNLYSRIRMNHAMLHRASRAVDTVRGFSWPSYSTTDLQTLLGTPVSPAYYDKSSGTELLPSGDINPNFQVIKKSQNIIMRRLDLLTSGALTGEEFCMVMGPKVAQKISECGEIVNYLKQSSAATGAPLMKRNGKWGIPDEYNGWKMVVEDTPRVVIQPVDTTTTFASVSTDSTKTGSGAVVAYKERDYVWNDDTVMFMSRAGGLDGNLGENNFSTVQMFYYGGLANVQARTDNWHEIMEGSIDLEDDFKVAAPLSGFKLTGTLGTGGL